MAKKSKKVVGGVFLTLEHQNMMNQKISKGVSIVCFFNAEDVSLAQLNEVSRLRDLRHPKKDWANNNGYPFFDGDLGGIVTGCEATANLIQEITGIRGNYKYYPTTKL